MKDTKIRWADSTWNFTTGCDEISDGCSACYARIIAERFAGSAFPNGFIPTFKPQKLGEPLKWREPRKIFVNSMSDLFHKDFTDDQIDQGFEVMLKADWHSYLLLTKRPDRMRRYILKWLKQKNLETVPPQIWCGTTIESNQFVWRADRLRDIPAPIRWISAEPLLSDLPDLNLDGIAWIVVGGESGNHINKYPERRMDMTWAQHILSQARAAGTAYYFKQDSGIKTEERPYLVNEDGTHTVYEEFPTQPTPQLTMFEV